MNANDILFEDKHIICIRKPIGVLSQSGAESTDMTDIITMLTAREQQSGISEPYIGIVHRLDAGVGGAMVYAKKPYAAAALSEAIRSRDFTKEYLCVVSGVPENEVGEYSDLLWKDSAANKSYVVNKVRTGVREAHLSYRVLQTVQHAEETYSLLLVTLGTGRSHQIRCQMSHHGTPIIADGKYGGHRPSDVTQAGIALWSYHLAFLHPANMPRQDAPPASKKPVTARQRKRQEKKPVFENPDIRCLPDIGCAPWSWFSVWNSELLCMHDDGIR